LNVEKKSKEESKTNKEEIEAFKVINAERASELYTEHLVPIYEEYDKRNLPEKKAFRIVPRELVAKILKFESNSMIPEDNFTETEKQVLNVFRNKKYFKSAKVAGRTFYFGLDSKIRRYMISVLGR
jgi:hypothetical protein